MEVALCDIDEKSLSIMTKILERMVRKGAKIKGYEPNQIKIIASTDRRVVLENADFVYKSISVGLQRAEWYDIYLPMKFGIPQNTGDTVGPGGVFRGLRTNPVVAEIARDMRELCPKAPLLNYTNPQSTIVMAARTVAPDIQFIGLCHELFGGMKAMRNFTNQYLGKSVKNWQDIDVEYGGVNHFAWITKINYQGEDLYPPMKNVADELVKKDFSRRGFNFFLLQKHGWFPYPGSRHVAEFMTDYYNRFNYNRQSPYWHIHVIRSVWALDLRRKWRYRNFAAMASGLKSVPTPIKDGERALEMTMDFRDNIPNPHVVNIPNTHPDYDKIIPQLPDDCVVEIPGYFKDGKILPVKTVNLPDEVADLIRPHAEQQRLTVDAALGNDLDLVIKAMQHDTMANWIEDDEKLEYLAKLMLFYEQEWLPPEWKEWIPKESELKQSRYWVSKHDISKCLLRYRKIKYPPSSDLKQKAYLPDNAVYRFI